MRHSDWHAATMQWQGRPKKMYYDSVDVRYRLRRHMLFWWQIQYYEDHPFHYPDEGWYPLKGMTFLSKKKAIATKVAMQLQGEVFE